MAVHTYDFTAKVPGSPFMPGGTESRSRLLGLITNTIDRITLTLNSTEEAALDQYDAYYASIGYERND